VCEETRQHGSEGRAALQCAALTRRGLYCVLASSSYLAMEIYAIVRPAQSQALLVRCRTWVDSHTDQAIIAGSLIIGFWFIADSLYLMVS